MNRNIVQDSSINCAYFYAKELLSGPCIIFILYLEFRDYMRVS